MSPPWQANLRKGQNNWNFCHGDPLAQRAMHDPMVHPIANGTNTDSPIAPMVIAIGHLRRN
jgi:hypothetical protein